MPSIISIVKITITIARVYTGCIRALDFLCSLPEYDGENLGVIGGSQGGALAMVTAGLDSRVKALVAFYPALCDVTGYLHGVREDGQPCLAPQNQLLNNKPEKIETSRYYDVVNFARIYQAPDIIRGDTMTLPVLPLPLSLPTMSSLLPNNCLSLTIQVTGVQKSRT